MLSEVAMASSDALVSSLPQRLTLWPGLKTSGPDVLAASSCQGGFPRQSLQHIREKLGTK